MKTNLKNMQCGGCGCDTFKVYTNQPELRIFVECTNCGSVSEIKPTQPELEIDWVEGSGKNDGGRLCIF